MIIRRLVSLIPVMFLVSIIVFSLSVLIPGDPAVTLAGGENATVERIAQIREELGFDDPLLSQYWDWLSGAVRGDLGDSLLSGQSVTSEIFNLIPVTFSLMVAAMTVGLAMGIPTGLLAGMRPGSRLDRALMFGTTLGIALPNFWLAIMLVTVFSVNLGWFPAIGFDRITDDPLGWLESVILPSFALGILVAASVARQLRAELADVMQSNFIRTMWAKGGTPRVVIGKHAFKNASIPAITVIGLQLGGLLGGTVLIEQIFSIPGLGTYVLRAIYAQDLPVIQGVAMFFVITNVVMNLLVDIAYGLVNPRVRIS